MRIITIPLTAFFVVLLSRAEPLLTLDHVENHLMLESGTFRFLRPNSFPENHGEIEDNIASRIFTEYEHTRAFAVLSQLYDHVQDTSIVIPNKTDIHGYPIPFAQYIDALAGVHISWQKNPLIDGIAYVGLLHRAKDLFKLSNNGFKPFEGDPDIRANLPMYVFGQYDEPFRANTYGGRIPKLKNQVVNFLVGFEEQLATLAKDYVRNLDAEGYFPPDDPERLPKLLEDYGDHVLFTLNHMDQTLGRDLNSRTPFWQVFMNDRQGLEELNEILVSAAKSVEGNPNEGRSTYLQMVAQELKRTVYTRSTPF